MALHKFKVGESVTFSPARLSLPAYAVEYKILRLMPPEGGECMYRVKCAAEPFERTARERDLSRRS